MRGVAQQEKRKVKLVLGGGGARGIAHIRVIELLEKDGFEIVEVIGCSMGAVVGGIYCTGFLREYRDWLLTLNRPQLFHLMDFTLTNMGFLKGERILGKMHELTGDQMIEQLPIPFVAIATDMVQREEVQFREGDLYTAMRASMSIPGVFTPVMYNNSILVDGGVLNPLPLDLVKDTEDTLTVAVSLNGRTPASNPMPDAEVSVQQAPRTWLQRFISHSKHKTPINQPKFSLIDLMTNSFEFTQDKLVELSIKAHEPDMLIEIPRTSCGLFDFHKAGHMLEIGEREYERAKEIYDARPSLPVQPVSLSETSQI